MDLGLGGAVAFIIGGTGTVGTAVAKALVAEGCTVVLGARSIESLQRTTTAVGAAGFVSLDTREQASVDAAVAEVIATHGSIGVLVNAAAPSARTLDRGKDTDPTQILDAVDGKAMGYLRCANAVIPHMRANGFGRIVNVSGQNALISGSMTAAVRNASVSVFSKSLADAVAGSGVTVNVVNPAIITETPSTEVASARGGDSTPAQVAALVAFLASDAAGAISGEAIAVGHRLRGIVTL